MSSKVQTVAEESQEQLPVYKTYLEFFLHYNDGRIMQLLTDKKDQLAENECTWGTLKREGLEVVDVYRKREVDEGVFSSHLIFQLILEPDKKFIWTRRTIMEVGKPIAAFWIIGWRKNIAGEDVQSINLIYEETDIIQNLPRFREMAPFHAPDFNAAEK